jgi:hypothetical protein
MSHIFAKKKSLSSFCSKQSEASSSSIIPSNQKQKEIKSSLYKDLYYKILFITKSNFLDESDLKIISKNKIDYQSFLSAKQLVPNNFLFRDNLFKSICRNI